MMLLQTEESYKYQLSSGHQFLKLDFVLPEDGTHVPKHVGDAPLIFVLINAVYLVGVINYVL